ncbi:MAG: hypothetical protein GY866_25750 [Proteobacteria bacterium]|nr:hypothetical protein [Pseudomonadota bacterium]
MGTILNSLKSHAMEKAERRTVADVRMGLSYTAVLLDDGAAGVAMTFHREIPQGCLSLERPLAGRNASEIVAKADSPDLLERTVALAAINAVLNTRGESLVGGDTLELLKPGEDDIVGMVGHFGPLVPKLKNTVKELRIFERTAAKARDLYPADKAFEMLPSCTMAIVTSTSLVNLTFEAIAEAAVNCRQVALLGASTPLAPDVFAEYGIDLLSGIVVADAGQILRVVSESGGMRSFGPYIDKVNVLCRS